MLLLAMGSRQCIRKKKEEEQKFNPGFTLIGLSGTPRATEFVSFTSMN